MKKFNYTLPEKDSYTKEEIAEMKKHLDAYQASLEKEYDGMDAELKPVRAAAKKAKLSAFLPENANSELADDIFALASLNDGMTEDEIKTALKTVVETRTFLQKSKQADATPKAEKKMVKPTEGKIETPEEETKRKRFKNL